MKKRWIVVRSVITPDGKHHRTQSYWFSLKRDAVARAKELAVEFPNDIIEIYDTKTKSYVLSARYFS